MPKKTEIGNLALTGYDALFTSTVETPVIPAETNGERIIEIALTELHPPEFHPFHVTDDEAMERLAGNIKQYGVREPGLARPRTNGGYELLAGNRRKRACEIAERPTLPVIIREMTDDEATIAMVDSNLEQRDSLLFSEKAWAYKIKMEALNHSGIKGDRHSHEIMVEQTGESKNQIFRLIRLTDLIVGLLDKVDAKQLAFNPAVELSYLSQKEQTAVINAMESHGIKPSLSQAVQLKKLKQADELTLEMIDEILSEAKKPNQDDNEVNEVKRYRHFFPKGYTIQQMDEIIHRLLTDWQSQKGESA
ncbi:MAG: ParB/RepB/Spo0J family partition protein [Defluviitaleaceae bacterium]|nr:ParB/RepB/Spo0J family partition protein [Defluviitaleaceae bacterium]